MHLEGNRLGWPAGPRIAAWDALYQSLPFVHFSFSEPQVNKLSRKVPLLHPFQDFLFTGVVPEAVLKDFTVAFPDERREAFRQGEPLKCPES